VDWRVLNDNGEVIFHYLFNSNSYPVQDVNVPCPVLPVVYSTQVIQKVGSKVVWTSTYQDPTHTLSIFDLSQYSDGLWRPDGNGFYY